MTPRWVPLLSRPWALVLLIGLPAVGVVAVLRERVSIVPVYASDAMIAIDARYHTTAQASVIAAGGDAVVKQMVADGGSLPASVRDEGLQLTVAPNGADQILVTGEFQDPDELQRMVNVAAERVVVAAETERRRLSPGVSAATSNTTVPPAAALAEHPDVAWARDRLNAYLAARPKMTAAVARRVRDETIVEILERGAAAGRQAVAVQREMQDHVQAALTAVTDPWYAYPLRVVRAASDPRTVRDTSLLRPAIGGLLAGIGAALVLIALVAALPPRSAHAPRARPAQA